jgi:hypothetical protein
MKKITAMNRKNILQMLAISTMLICGCQPDKINDYVPRTAGDVASVTGTWTGTSVLQRDNDAERKNFPYKSEDVTSTLEFTKVKITLNSADGQPTTFGIDYGGAPPFLKLTSGGWKVDDAKKIGKISLYNGLDTVKFTLGNYLLINQSKLQLQQGKSLLGKDVITYEYNLSK